jgi:hypothetical protein
VFLIPPSPQSATSSACTSVVYLKDSLLGWGVAWVGRILPMHKTLSSTPITPLPEKPQKPLFREVYTSKRTCNHSHIVSICVILVIGCWCNQVLITLLDFSKCLDLVLSFGSGSKGWRCGSSSRAPAEQAQALSSTQHYKTQVPKSGPLCGIWSKCPLKAL